MTVQEMHLAVKLGLDKTSNFALPSLLPEEIDYWLNEGQLQVVKQKAFGNNFRQEDLNTGVKRIDDLTPLIKESVSFSSGTITQHSNYTNVKTLARLQPSLSDYMFFISATCKYSDNKVGETKLIPYTSINNLVVTEYNRPFLRNPYVYITNDYFNFIINPDSTLSSVSFRYIKTPKQLVRTSPVGEQTTESELPNQVHPEIVAATVNMLLENLESQRVQTNEVQLSRKE